MDTCNVKRGSFGAGMFIVSRQAHGDLSNIRPKSPPLYNFSAAFGRLHIDGHPTQGLRLPHGRYVDVSHGVCSGRDLQAILGDSCAQDTPVFNPPLAAQSNQWSTSEVFEPTKHGSHEVC